MDSKVCRICIKNFSNLISIFTSPIGEDIGELADLISSCAKIEISIDDGLPDQICSNCAEEAIISYKFINKCFDSDSFLRNIPKLSSSPTSENDENLLLWDMTDDPEEETSLQPEKNEKNAEEEHLMENEEYYVEYLDEDMKSENREVNSEDNLNSNSSKDEPNAIIRCCGARCRMIFSDELSLMTHVSAIHEPKREINNTDKPHECDCCYARFESRKILSLHKRRIVNDFKCHICKLLFDSSLKKKIHLSEVHTKEERNKAKPQCYTIDKMPIKVCCDCKQTFETEEKLREHGLAVHSTRKLFEDDVKDFQCYICFKYFKSFESMRVHQISVYKQKSYQCIDCGKSFESQSKLATHESIHKTVRDFKCEICTKAFKRKHDLNAHMLLHMEKKEQCKICGLRFHRRTNLRLHMVHHSNSFDHSCSVCPKKFRTKTHLNEHFKSHTGDKPYQCKHCDKKFAYYSDRKRHEMTHTGDYPFVCVCSKKFARRPLFLKHQKSCIQCYEIQ